MREENLKRGLEGICVSCNKSGLQLRDIFDGTTLYRDGACTHCTYDHHIFVSKI